VRAFLQIRLPLLPSHGRLNHEGRPTGVIRDYGFIPGTLAEDGDPVDVMVLLGEPAFPGCAVTARPVGVFWLTDEKGPDAKVLAVPARDPRYAGLRDLSDVPGHLLDEIGHFFGIYKELEPGNATDVALD